METTPETPRDHRNNSEGREEDPLAPLEGCVREKWGGDWYSPAQLHSKGMSVFYHKDLEDGRCRLIFRLAPSQYAMSECKGGASLWSTRRFSLLDILVVYREKGW